MADTQAKAEATTAQAAPGQPEFIIQRLYVKDLSYEAPNTPEIFRSEWKPEVNLDIQTNSSILEADTHEVILALTVTVKSGDKTAFLVEVKQAGIFTIKGIVDEALKHTLGSYCPNIIFPYAREVVADVVGRGGFPQLNLAPINFDALYAQYQQEVVKQKAEGEGETKH